MIHLSWFLLQRHVQRYCGKRLFSESRTHFIEMKLKFHVMLLVE